MRLRPLRGQRPVLHDHERGSERSKTASNCILRGIPGNYTRASTGCALAPHHRRPVRPGLHAVRVRARRRRQRRHHRLAGRVQFRPRPGQNEVARFMPTAGVEYRYPFINVQSWGTQTIEPIAQFVMSPNETNIGALPNEDSQSFMFDASNLFRANKFAGWDRVEGGGRLNVGGQYTAQFHQGGYLNVLVGQSYHLFGLNSFAVASPTNTGLDSGLDKARSDYVARVVYQPNSQLTLSSRFRFDEGNYSTAARRIRGVVQLRALDDDGHVRLLRAAARDRVPGRSRKASPRPPGSRSRRTGRPSAASGTTCGPIRSTKPRSAWATSTTASSWP